MKKRPCLKKVLTMTTYKILDGATGTTLTHMGFESIDHDELWSAKILANNPTVLEKLHKDFISAGSTEILSATYQMPDPRKDLLMASKIAENARKLCEIIKNVGNVEISNKKINFYAELGPYGASLHDGSEYNGNYFDTDGSNLEKISIEKIIYNHHKTRMNLLCPENDTTVPGVQPPLFTHAAFSTIPALPEVKIIAKVMQENFPKLKYFISVQASFDENTQKVKLAHGESGQDFIKFMESLPEECFGYGLNCVDKGLCEKFLGEVIHFRSDQDVQAQKTLIFYPNIGKTWNGTTHTWEEPSITSSKNQGNGWVKNLHTLILAKNLEKKNFKFMVGGCCGTLPKDIGNLVEFMRTEDLNII